MTLQEALNLRYDDTYDDIKEEMLEDFLILMEDTLPTIRKYPSYSAPLWWKESYGPWDLVKRFRVAITKLDEDLFYVQNGEKGRAKSNIVFAWEVLHEIPKNE